VSFGCLYFTDFFYRDLDVYAVHPQGGETDGMSQIYGRVLNHAKRLLVCLLSHRKNLDFNLDF
jgi:hypothetical protein